MADGLARLLAPILPVTADEMWRHLPGRTRGLGSRRRIPGPRRRRRAGRSGADGALGAPDRHPRRGQPRARGGAPGEDHRQLAGCAGGAARRRRDRRAAASYRDDLPMLFIVSQVTLDIVARRAGCAGTRRLARRRAQVRALLAYRRRDLSSEAIPKGSATGASTPSEGSRRRDRRRPTSAEAPAAPRPPAAASRGRSRSSPSSRCSLLDQLTKQIVRTTLPLHDSFNVIPGVAGSHARPQHGRGVRPAERRRLSLQAGRS